MKIRGIRQRWIVCRCLFGFYEDLTEDFFRVLLVVAGVAADIMGKIRECGFEISAVFMVSLDKANAEEFLEIYKGVVQEYPMMVTELCAGPCIALEIRAQDAVKTFREFAGPADPVSFQQPQRSCRCCQQHYFIH